MSATRNKLLALIAIAGIVGACSGSATPAPATAAPATAAPATAAPATAAPSPSPDGTLPKPELTSVKIGISAFTEPNSFRSQLAVMLGFYEKYGLKAEVIGFEGDGKTLQAIQAGQIDFAVGAVANTLSTQQTDTPLILLAMGNLTVGDALWCKDPIKVAADVVGKTIAISTYGGTSHGSSLLALKALGLKSSEVSITQVGGEAARIAALKAGSIDCIVAGRDLGDVMKQAGAAAVVDLQTVDVQFGTSGHAVRKEWLAKYPNTALVAIAAALEAQNIFWTDLPTAIAKFTEFSGQDPEDAAKYVTAYQKAGNRSLMWSDDALAIPRDTLATVKPELATVDLAACSDHTVLQKLVDLGFYAKIGSPVPTQ